MLDRYNFSSKNCCRDGAATAHTDLQQLSAQTDPQCQGPPHDRNLRHQRKGLADLCRSARPELPPFIISRRLHKSRHLSRGPGHEVRPFISDNSTLIERYIRVPRHTPPSRGCNQIHFARPVRPGPWPTSGIRRDPPLAARCSGHSSGT
jgi:hypothetical protein